MIPSGEQERPSWGEVILAAYKVPTYLTILYPAPLRQSRKMIYRDKVSNYKNVDGDGEQDLTALGFLFDAAAAKAWVRHRFQAPLTSPFDCHGEDKDMRSSIQVEVQVIADEDGPGALQTGQRTWPAAPFLAQYLVEHWAGITFDRKCEVLELGAGCGLVGLTLAQLSGVDSIIMTDHDPGSLKLIQEGIYRNQHRWRDGVRCEISHMEWGKKLNRQIVSLVNIERVNAEHGSGKEGIMLLLVGSDLVYSLDVVESLFKTVADLFRHRDESGRGRGQFLLCGSFALGDEIEKRIAEVTERLKLCTERLILGREDERRGMWITKCTLA